MEITALAGLSDATRRLPRIRKKLSPRYATRFTKSEKLRAASVMDTFCPVINISQKIESGAIAEVNLSTFPPSLVYNGNEIIFVQQENKLEIEQFAKQNKIPILNRFDI